MKNQYRVVMFKEEKFPSSIGLPLGLTPEWLGWNLQTQGWQVSYFNVKQLSDRSLFNADEIDLLVLSYGEAFPLEAFNFIQDYIEEGGGLFSIAGKPFWKPMKKIGSEWLEVPCNSYEEFLSKLGIKYYQSEIKPVACEFNQELFNVPIGKFLFTESAVGVSVVTGEKINTLAPTHGNVFPYRLPCRNFMPVARSLNEFGEILACPMILVKSWKNPYKKEGKIPNKWCLNAISGEKHPFNPQWPYAKTILNHLMGYLSEKIVIHNLETDYACYHQGEQVKFEAQVLNYGRIKKALQANLKIKDSSNKIVYQIIKEIELLPDTEITIGDLWIPRKFSDDFYVVEAVIEDNGRFIDKETNGFVVWNDETLSEDKQFEINGKDFFIGGKKTFLSGTNYYESKLGELAWLHPNMLSITEDFQKMQKLGINFIRIHYHHSKWFRDYIVKVAQLPLDNYFEAADKSTLPSKRSLRIFDAFIQLSQKYDLIFCADLFTLVPEEMGNPKGWLGLAERIIEPQKIRIQKEFIKILAKRYKDISGITWDLWNEPRLEKQEDIDLLKEWAKQLVTVFRENGDKHPITVGEDVSLELLDVLDYVSIHTYEPEKFNPPSNLNKPFIFQEVWNDVGCSLEDEIKQAEKLKKDFYSALEKGASGFAPWQWIRQARLWNDTNQPEQWDDELGTFTHDDGTLKPAGKAYSLLINELKQ